MSPRTLGIMGRYTPPTEHPPARELYHKTHMVARIEKPAQRAGSTYTNTKKIRQGGFFS